MDKQITLNGALLICLAIILGAFAAHSLEKVIHEDMIVVFEKGVKYQMYTGIGLLVLGLNANKIPFQLKWVHYLLLFGVIIFSGCIYVLAFKEFQEALKYFGAIVPIGGSMMIVGWLVFIFKLIGFKKTDA